MIKRFLFNPNCYRNKIFITAQDVIGEYAFAGCEDFDYISFDESLKVIKRNAFDGWPNLAVVDFGSDKINSIKQQKDEEIFYFISSKIEVVEKKSNDDDLLIIQAETFRNCKRLHTVILPCDKNIRIEKNAFVGCDKLRNVVAIGDDILFSEDAFLGCPESLTFICTENSSVDIYARENGFKTVYVELESKPSDEMTTGKKSDDSSLKKIFDEIVKIEESVREIESLVCKQTEQNNFAEKK